MNPSPLPIEGREIEPESDADFDRDIEITTVINPSDYQTVSLEISRTPIKNSRGIWAVITVRNHTSSDFKGSLLIGEELPYSRWGGAARLIDRYEVFVGAGEVQDVECFASNVVFSRWGDGDLEAVLMRPIGVGEENSVDDFEPYRHTFGLPGVFIDSRRFFESHRSSETARLTVSNAPTALARMVSEQVVDLPQTPEGMWKLDPAFLAGFASIGFEPDITTLPDWAVEYFSKAIRAGSVVECLASSGPAQQLFAKAFHGAKLEPIYQADLKHVQDARTFPAARTVWVESDAWFDWETPFPRRAKVLDSNEQVHYAIGFGFLSVGNEKRSNWLGLQNESIFFNQSMNDRSLLGRVEYAKSLALSTPVVAGLVSLMVLSIFFLAYRAKKKAPAGLLAMTSVMSLILVVPAIGTSLVLRAAAEPSKTVSVNYIDEKGELCLTREVVATVGQGEGPLSIPTHLPFSAAIHHRPVLVPEFLDAVGSRRTMGRKRIGLECRTVSTLNTDQAGQSFPLPKMEQAAVASVQWEEDMIAVYLMRRDELGAPYSTNGAVAYEGRPREMTTLHNVISGAKDSPTNRVSEEAVALLEGLGNTYFQNNGMEGSQAFRARTKSHGVVIIVRRASELTPQALPDNEVSSGYRIDIHLLPAPKVAE